MKKCRDCGEIKSLDEFNIVISHKGKYQHYRLYCKKCKNKHDNGANITTAEYRFKIRIKSKYGITIEEYQNLFKSQKGNCTICKEDLLSFPKNPAIDHCHNTGKIRGLLCNNCNSGIGLLGDDYKRCLDASKYLKHHLKEDID